MAQLDTTVSGLVAGDTLAGTTCTTGADEKSPVGTYPITCSGTTSTNYRVTHVAGTLTVHRAKLTVRGPQAAREQGQADPALTPTYVGLVAGETEKALQAPAVCASVAAPASPAGSYAVRCDGVQSASYDVTYLDGVLTVTAAPVVASSSPSPVVTSPSPSPVVTEPSPVATSPSPTAAPVLVAPTALAVDAVNPTGARVSWTATVQPAGTAASCSRAQGSVFAIGRSTVTCTAGASSKGFTVHVRSAAEQLALLKIEVTDQGPGKSLEQQVDNAIKAKPGQAAAALRTFQGHLKAQSGKSHHRHPGQGLDRRRRPDHHGPRLGRTAPGRPGPREGAGPSCVRCDRDRPRGPDRARAAPPPAVAGAVLA